MSVKNIFITGANGFIGRHIVSALASNANLNVIAAMRTPHNTADKNACTIAADYTQAQWQSCLKGVDVIIHCAARAHIVKEQQENAAALYQQVNVDMTENLAQAALQEKVKRFVFISTIGVQGALSHKPFTEQSALSPHSTYAESKLCAENILLDITKQQTMDVCIIRAPLVYGPGVGANFLRMIKWLDTNIPLPFGAIHNSRSLLGVSNLTSFINICLFHPNASNQVFLLSDDADISTTQLLRKIATHLAHRSKLLPVPLFMVKCLLTLIGKKKMLNQLCGSLQIDSSKARQCLNWTPPVSLDAELERTLMAYRKGDL